MPLLADIHNHALFGLDDGAADLDESVRMLEISYAQGVRLLCLTPHCNPHLFPRSTRQRADENFVQLFEIAREKFPDLTLLQGNEFYIFGSSVDSLREGLCRPLGESRTLLVEFAPDVLYSELENSLRAVRSLGYRPLVAHAERYECLLREPTRVGELVAMRAAVQVNASSVLASFLSPVGRFVRRLLKEGLVHVIASDGHGAVRRTPQLLEAYGKVASRYGNAAADALFYKNPRQFVLPEKE